MAGRGQCLVGLQSLSILNRLCRCAMSPYIPQVGNKTLHKSPQYLGLKLSNFGAVMERAQEWIASVSTVQGPSSRVRA